jgi:hypothetical protein
MEEKPKVTSPLKPKSRKRTVICAIFVVVLMAIASLATWFWRQTEIDDLKTAQSGIPAETSPDTSTSIDPADTANWSEILLGPTTVGGVEDGKLAGLSFRLPVGWTVLDCGNVSALAAHVSPTSSTQAHCNSEGTAPITIVVQSGDIREGYDYSDTTVYSDQKTETVTVHGHAFTRSSATFAHPIEFMPAAGSMIVSYIAVIDGVSYAASYVHQANDPTNLTADFDKIITVTLAVTTP